MLAKDNRITLLLPGIYLSKKSTLITNVSTQFTPSTSFYSSRKPRLKNDPQRETKITIYDAANPLVYYVQLVFFIYFVGTKYL